MLTEAYCWAVYALRYKNNRGGLVMERFFSRYLEPFLAALVIKLRSSP